METVGSFSFISILSRVVSTILRHGALQCPMVSTLMIAKSLNLLIQILSAFCRLPSLRPHDNILELVAATVSGDITFRPLL